MDDSFYRQVHILFRSVFLTEIVALAGNFFSSTSLQYRLSVCWLFERCDTGTEWSAEHYREEDEYSDDFSFEREACDFHDFSCV